MSERVGDPPRASGRRRRKPVVWSQSADTKRAVLDAAKAMFAENGYEHTTISDIVARSGVSVGSIYHQFGGKAEICRALLEREFSRFAAASWQAVDDAQRAGETNEIELYLAGATAYLLETWRDRETARITLGEDSPPEAAELRHDTESRFMQAAARSMSIGNPPTPDSSPYAVTSLLRAAAVQLLDIDDERLARQVIDYYVGLIRTLATSSED